MLVVIGGPNGAGKTTSAPSLLQRALCVGEFVNADAVALGLSAFRPESAAIAAGRAMLTRLQALAAARHDFAFETTLASRSFAPWIQDLRRGGYRAHLAFLALPSADLAVARVDERVRRGGHHVPEEVIRRRFRAGLRNFFGIYREVVDAWQVLDNAGPLSPRLVAEQAPGGPTMIHDRPAWDTLREASQ